MKLLSVGLLFFASGALALDYKLTYSCYNKNGGVDGKGNNEAKAAGKVDDDLADKIEDKMGEWSEDKYQGKKNTIRHTITVVCKEKVDSKPAALNAIEEQMRIVKEHQDD